MSDHAHHSHDPRPRSAPRPSISVLLVEDDEDDFLLTRELLDEAGEGSYEVRWERSYDAALRALADARPDVVLLDYRLDGRTGLDLLRAIGGEGAPPVILLTGLGDRELDLAAMDAGAADYLVKGQLTAGGLDRTLRYSLQRWRVEQELRASDDAHRSLLDAAPVGILCAGPAGEIFEANLMAEQLTGYAGEELRAMRLADLAHLEDRREIAAALTRLADGGWGRTTAELRWIRRDGSTFVASLGLSKRVDGGGALRQVVITVEDVTERREVDEQLSRARTFEAVGRLAGGVAHDVNNLVTVIRGFATLSELGVQNGEDISACLQELRAATDEPAALASELLAYSRRQPIARQRVDLNRVLSGLEAAVRERLAPRIELRLVQALGLPTVQADPRSIQQVVGALVAFAREGLAEGGEVTLATRQVTLSQDDVRFWSPMRSGRWVELAISDTGAALTAEQRARVFEPFFSSAEMGRGTGLGLATAYGRVKQNEGYIWVESAPAEGTTFRVFFTPE